MANHRATDQNSSGSMTPIGANTKGGKAYEHSSGAVGFASGKGAHRLKGKRRKK